MLRLLLTFITLFSTLFCALSTHGQVWSDAEIKRIQGLSLNSHKIAKDPSNKYLNNANAVKFGKSLFEDMRLSSNGKISCSSCHIKVNAFTDNKKIAQGIKQGFRNTPTLLNVSQHQWFFADGAKDSLWAQSLSSIENPAEHNFTRTEVMHLIASDKQYRSNYKKIFKESLPTQAQLEGFPFKAGPNAKLEHLIEWKKLNKSQKNKVNTVFTNVGKSIAAFVSTIKPEPTRFDYFADRIKPYRKSSDLTTSEQRGLRLFMSKESGCASCHHGPFLSNKTFHHIDTGIPGKDNGRSEVIESVLRDEFNCLGKHSDAKPEQCAELNFVNRNKHQLSGTYKTPTLRGIKHTSPYMHDGRFDNLSEVIEHYVVTSQDKQKKTDLSPISLTEKQRTDLINFLLTL